MEAREHERIENPSKNQFASSSPQSPTLSSAIDSQRLQYLRNVTGTQADEVVGELIDCYLEDAPRRLQTIQDAVNQGNARVLHNSAHSLMGLSISLGANSLAEICHKLEIMGRAGTTVDASSLVDQLAVEYERVEAALLLERPNRSQ